MGGRKSLGDENRYWILDAGSWMLDPGWNSVIEKLFNYQTLIQYPVTSIKSSASEFQVHTYHKVGARHRKIKILSRYLVVVEITKAISIRFILFIEDIIQLHNDPCVFQDLLLNAV